jgi:hypothetical protein
MSRIVVIRSFTTMYAMHPGTFTLRRLAALTRRLSRSFDVQVWSAECSIEAQLTKGQAAYP